MCYNSPVTNISSVFPAYSCLLCGKDSKQNLELEESRIIVCVNCLATSEGKQLNQDLEDEANGK